MLYLLESLWQYYAVHSFHTKQPSCSVYQLSNCFPHIFQHLYQKIPADLLTLQGLKSLVGFLQACQKKLKTDNNVTVLPVLQDSSGTIQARGLRSVTH